MSQVLFYAVTAEQYANLSTKKCKRHLFYH